MKRYYEHRVATYQRKYDEMVIDTREGWARKGYIIKQRHQGEMMYTNGYRGQTALYYFDSDVRKDAEGAGAYLAKLAGKRNARRRKLARTKKDRCYAKEMEKFREETAELVNQARNYGTWMGYLSATPRVLIFDTETSGLSAVDNNMLSISWQLIEFSSVSKEWKILEEKNYYFDWPEDARRVTEEAISVNGLTKERLAQLGTSSKKDALADFSNAMKKAGLAVAHNAEFDLLFIRCEAQREGLDELPSCRVYDTMKRMTAWCGIEWYEGASQYKWPKLSELAECLDIDTSDIEYHLSAADVEVTKRCFMAIVKRGLTSI